jgi:transposase
MSRDYFWLTKHQFARLKPLLPNDTRGKPRVDDRRVISGIIQVLKSGGRWIDAPEVYGLRKTLYNRFVRWAAKGVWVDIFHALATAGGPPAQVLIDSSAVLNPGLQEWIITLPASHVGYRDALRTETPCRADGRLASWGEG